MTATVSVRGQIVIPAKIRKKFNIKPKTKIDFIETGGGLYLIPVPKDPFRASRGILKGVSSEDVIRMRREERKLEEKKYKQLYATH